MHVQYCMFKRNQLDFWTEGVMINHSQLIIDTNCEPVLEVWDYQLRPSDGCFNCGPCHSKIEPLKVIKG